MPSKCYVFNEWLLNELRGDNGPQAQETAGRLLERLKGSRDRIAVSWQTPWVDKAWSLMRLTHPVARRLSRYLHLNILLDTRSCLRLHRSDLRPLPEGEKGMPEEDVYLVQVYHAARADMIVTSDTVFHDEAAKRGVPIVLRDEFIRQYLGED